MTAQPVEPLPPGALDPDSDVGRRTADAISDFEAEVITRLRAEGKPIPPIPHSP